MWIIVYFTDSGVPKTGLSPTIRIRDLSDDTLVVTDAAMTEVGDGCYKYDFAAYDSTKDYSIRCDGTATLSNIDRYAFAGSEWNGIDDIKGTGFAKNTHSLTNIDGIVDAILVDTDTTIPGLLATIQADLDNPDQYKAPRKASFRG